MGLSGVMICGSFSAEPRAARIPVIAAAIKTHEINAPDTALTLKWFLSTPFASEKI